MAAMRPNPGHSILRKTSQEAKVRSYGSEGSN